MKGLIMAGKKKGNSTGWGGTRPGAGRPKESLSQRQLKSMLAKGRKWAKERDGDVDDFILSVIHGAIDKLDVDSLTIRDRLTAAKLWKDCTMTKASEQNVNVQTQQGPVIALPPLRQDPALKVIKGGSDR